MPQIEKLKCQDENLLSSKTILTLENMKNVDVNGKKRGRPPNQKNNVRKDQMIVDDGQMNPKQSSGLSDKLEVFDSLPHKKR